jgi:single-strand DNA-binding protein
MRTVNKVILIGNVTRDPSVKQSEWKKKIALFTIATNRYFKTTTGENKSESEFHNCVAWGTLADKLETSLTKGKLVYIEWRLRTRIIEKENWEKNYKTEIVVTNLIFLNKKSDFTESSDDDILDDDLFEEDDKF